jgi:hypothetical protein
MDIHFVIRYIVMKADAMSRDPRRQRYDRHKRDIMPKCVVSLVRHWFPNPGGFPVCMPPPLAVLFICNAGFAETIWTFIL